MVIYLYRALCLALATVGFGLMVFALDSSAVAAKPQLSSMFMGCAGAYILSSNLLDFVRGPSAS